MLSILVSASTLATTIYAQEVNQTKFIDKEMNLILGKPIYVQEYTVSEKFKNNVDNNVSDLEFSFSSTGSLNGIEISVTGNGVLIPREDGTSSSIGKGFFTSMENGTASYSFQSIDYNENDIEKHVGTAYFDANATGNLEFLKSMVGVYKGQQENNNGLFVMWPLK
ncbi:MAG: hypothetical protein ACPKPY_13725 [Nitrososphaeraceae archaeon]